MRARRSVMPSGRQPGSSKGLGPARSIATLLAVLALVAACSGGAGGAGGAPDGGARLAQVEPLTDPGAYVGPSSAVLADSAIVPIAADPEPVLPVALTDAQGTEVTVTDVSRILALDIYGSTSRTVFELGLGENLVGRDTSSAYPEITDRPLVTANGHELNAESILDLAPTLIITDTSLGPWDVVLQMRDAGIPVVVVDSHRSLEGVGALIQQVADAVGLSAEGAALAARATADIEATVAQIAAVAPPEGQRLRIAFLYVRGQSGIYYLFGTGSGTDSLITALGGVDVATEIGWDGMRPLTDEGLIAAQPDLVLVMSKGLESVDGVDGLLEAVPALAYTPAGENRRVVDMDDSQILSFGPNTADVLDALAVAIYAPEANQ
ncbi:hemin ABC transporter substrate-binding protein [Occultella aeris]|uniref:Hemin-binding periplasmic protein HmuT n=1 Tax=Occultella aeris TaxID=2761496 RepID=A0A7M4DE74_9MICO|nr:ABC transporter substrate-binding protein [Occultella aeris]VZO35188.1 Hemin-binding periplasmic protein HmuT precursor [Occultella aeris]